MTEREQLEQAIAALEAQRALLGDAVVNAALAPMREKLAALTAAAAAPPARPEGQQRKMVTVLFADVSGFTAMSETMDAEEVSTTMNALWERLDGAILKQGGRIDKHIGDAVMALFGTPVAQEDDPERAIRAALDMQRELSGFLVDPAGQPRLRMRIGINTGPVLLGSVGTTGEYTAMGDTVNLASRLEHAAPIGGILISHDTYRHVRGIFNVNVLEPITVKGKSEPIHVYVVRSVKPKAFRVTTRGVEGIETRTIGREAELRAMQAAFETARLDRRTHLVSLVAEAGTGKSRLLYEFSNWLELQPHFLRLFRGRATQSMRRTPYALLRDILAFRFDIQDADRVAVVRTKLENGLVELAGPGAPEALMWAHFVGHLVGIDFSASPHLQGILSDVRQIRDRAVHYLAEFLETMSEQQPLVFLLEDIHWADNESLDALGQILTGHPNLTLTVIALTRPTLFEERPEWGQGPLAHIRLDLKPLSTEASRLLVGEILRKVNHLPPALVELIVSRAEGSPFYIEELIKMLIEDGVIVRGEEEWSVAADRLADVRVPATLTGILQARLDGLPAPEREALQQASVVGRVFWQDVVAHMHHPDHRDAPPPAAVAERLVTLNRKELIFPREDSAFSETPEYIFKHALLHDVTYESVLKRLRREYHLQVAETLIAMSGERAGEYAGRIGEHFERAGSLPHAAEWYSRAGRQALNAHAPLAAIEYFQKALDFWRQSGTGPAQVGPLFLNTYMGFGKALRLQARYAEASGIYVQMRAQAEAAQDQAAQARAWECLAEVQGDQGDNRTALESATRAETLADQAGARQERLEALMFKGRALFRLGEAQAALAAGEQVLTLAEAGGDDLWKGRGLNLLGGVHYTLGQYDAARRRWEEALAVLQSNGDRLAAMNVLNNLGVIAEARGDYRQSFDWYQDALNIAVELGSRDGELVYLNNVGGARLALGDYAGAQSDLREVIITAGTAGSWILAYTYCYLGEACLRLGQLAEALEAAQYALRLGKEGGDQERVAAAWRVLGLIAAERQTPIPPGADDAPVDAAACFAESLRVCAETGMEGERARTLRELARYEHKHGDPARGTELWQEARAVFTRLGADLEAAQMAGGPGA